MFQIAFVDLDDTLFSSLHKQNECTGLESAALLREGTVISFSSPEQRALTSWIQQSDMVVPVTARTSEAFKRVLVKFHSFSVVSHGGTILLADQTPDLAWAHLIDEGLAAEMPALAELQRQLDAEFGGEDGLKIRMAGEPNRPTYLMAKDPGKDPEKVRAASEHCVKPWIQAHPGYMHHLNGNNLAILPPSISKRAAVAYLIQKLRASHGELFVVGAGDSLTDAPFLSLCHAALIPTRSQVWSAVKSLSGKSH